MKRLFCNKFIVFCLFIFSPSNFPQEIPFGYISTENGLSNNGVNCLLQDSCGFLWFGTDNGLNRFDGYDIKVYRNDEHDSASISNNGIWSLFQDNSGCLWIGTSSGEINRYDHKRDKFVHWSVNSGSLKENRITSIYKDKNGSLWIGTYKDGLYKFNKGKKSEHWLPNLQVKNSLSHNYVTSIIEDRFGSLWIGTYNGLNKLSLKFPEKGFVVFYSDPHNSGSLSGNLIWNLANSTVEEGIIWVSTSNGLIKLDPEKNEFRRNKLPDEGRIQFGNSVGSVVDEIYEKQRIIWCGTYAGLVRINLSNGKSKRFTADEENNHGLSSNSINYIMKDKSGVIWIATGDKGLNFISPKGLKFNNLSRYSVLNEEEFNHLCRENITAAAQTPDGIIWLGTDEGLYYLKSEHKILTVYSDPVLKNLNIWSLEAGGPGEIWIGTYGQGLKQFNLNSRKLKSWNIEDPSYPYKNPSFGFIKSVLKDRRGKIWIGCWGPGLVQLDPQSGNVKYWPAKEGSPGSLNYGDVWVIHEDRQNRIWIGTNGGGLNLYNDADGGRFISWIKGDKKGITLSDNNIQAICESRKSNEEETVLWVGTQNGLNKLIINNSPIPEIKYKSYTIKEGLPDNTIKSILEDDGGNLWIGTGEGISLLKYGEKKFINFTASDGLKGNAFIAGSALITKDGIIIFGSTGGLNIFSPDQIFQSHYSPPVLITRFQIFNEEVSVGEESPVKQNITSAKEINLSYDQNVFSFQFSSLDFNSPKSINYAYMMEGFDRDWIYSGSRRFITYTNLDPGTYAFKVKATNSDGIWTKNEASLKVVINPPWWRSFWAYFLYIFSIVAGFFAIRKFQINRAELRNELKMREFESKKLQELENLKSRFFANLSHEFRTPLMLIKGPLEQLLKSYIKKGENPEELQMIKRNSGRLQELIDQLLELSQLEAASIPLRAKQENAAELLKGIVSIFEPHMMGKNINLIFNRTEETVYAWIDRDKFEKIISNLLSNAIKFTPSGGTVSVLFQRNMNNIEIKISDTGIGIPKNQHGKIFNRFYQADNSAQKAFGGSGIGLALVKELVELHKWKISFHSEIEKGTEFSLLIPVDDSYLEEKDKISDSSLSAKPAEEPKDDSKNLEDKREKIFKISEVPGTAEKPAVLIVEDSSDVRKYISGLLLECFETSEAEDGESGLKKAAEEMPDLIISDIMMPFMDGLEFCRKLKTNWETSHIPVILLTAKASGESKIEGLETGADDYLTKPFDSRELLIRIKNLLEQRKRIKEKFSKEIRVSADALAANSTDNEFLKKAFGIVEKNLGEKEFNSEIFAQEMFVSRSQLHRKLVAVTGQAPGEFVRALRLKHAAALILKKDLSITQIAFEVGFSSASHFTQAFQQQFGCVPSEFRSKAKSQ